MLHLFTFVFLSAWTSSAQNEHRQKRKTNNKQVGLLPPPRDNAGKNRRITFPTPDRSLVEELTRDGKKQRNGEEHFP